MRSGRRTIQDEVGTLFKGPNDRDSASDYLRQLRENWKELNSALSRAFFLLLNAIVAFELVQRYEVAQISVAGIRLAGLAPIKFILPAIIAYAFYDIWTISAILSDTADAAYYVLRYLYGNLANTRIWELLQPRRHLLFGGLFVGREDPRAHTISALAGAAFWAFVFSYQIYAYFLLFADLGIENVFAWASLIVTQFFLIVGMINAYHWRPGPQT